MKAAVLATPGNISGRPLADVETPALAPGYVLLRVKACGVCRTDLHIVEGELKPVRGRVIPGHQIVGEVVDGPLPKGARVGVTWMAGTDDVCPYCLRGEENLCDAPSFTGYTVDVGYAGVAVARA